MKPYVAVATVVIGATAAVIASGWALHSCQQRGWEGVLHGPFAGAPYTTGITTAPISVLRMPRGGQLEVHESPASSNAVVLLRSPSNDIRWARFLVPERKLHDGAVETTWVRELRLDRVQQRSSGWAVFVVCNWGWGGREGGIVYLDPAGNFQKFALSW